MDGKFSRQRGVYPDPGLKKIMETDDKVAF